MDDPDSIKFQPQWKRLEPLDQIPALRVADLPDEEFVTAHVLLAMSAHVIGGAVWVPRGVGNGIELVVAHDHLSRSGAHHGPDGVHGCDLVRPTVDEIADEDRLASRIPESAIVFSVSKFVQKSAELVGTAVDVTNDVPAGHAQQLLTIDGLTSSKSTSDSMF